MERTIFPVGDPTAEETNPLVSFNDSIYNGGTLLPEYCYAQTAGHGTTATSGSDSSKEHITPPSMDSYTGDDYIYNGGTLLPEHCYTQTAGYGTTPALQPNLNMQCTYSAMESWSSSYEHQFPVPLPQAVHIRRIECWLHGCKGRIFSTVSNYRRHCKEQDGFYKKPTCPACKRCFTREAARDRRYNEKRCRVTEIDENGVPFRRSIITYIQRQKRFS